MTQYEHTSFTMRLAPDELAPTEPVRRRDIFDDGSAFVLENLLSRDECAFYIKQCENIGFKSCQYDPTIRVTSRISVNVPRIAAVLFERALPFIGDPIDVPHGAARPRGIAESAIPGTWNPIGLNEVFRVCRYTKGGFFRPHWDYGFERTTQERSLKTFMFYLNDDYEGAPTTFYTEEQQPYQEPEERHVLERVRVPAGGVLVFSSNIMHDGGLLARGKKYIMRTEVMYAWGGAPRDGFSFGGQRADRIEDESEDEAEQVEEGQTEEGGGSCTDDCLD